MQTRSSRVEKPGRNSTAAQRLAAETRILRTRATKNPDGLPKVYVWRGLIPMHGILLISFFLLEEYIASAIANCVVVFAGWNYRHRRLRPSGEHFSGGPGSTVRIHSITYPLKTRHQSSAKDHGSRQDARFQDQSQP